MIRLSIIVFTFLAIDSHSLEGKWSKLFSGNGITFYIDLHSLNIKKNTRSINLLIDNEEPNTHGDYSSVIKREFKCNEFMYRDWEKDFYLSTLHRL